MNETLIDACIAARTMIDAQPVPMNDRRVAPVILPSGVPGNRIMLALTSLRLAYLGRMTLATVEHRRQQKHNENQRLRSREYWAHRRQSFRRRLNG